MSFQVSGHRAASPHPLGLVVLATERHAARLPWKRRRSRTASHAAAWLPACSACCQCAVQRVWPRFVACQPPCSCILGEMYPLDKAARPDIPEPIFFLRGLGWTDTSPIDARFAGSTRSARAARAASTAGAAERHKTRVRRRHWPQTDGMTRLSGSPVGRMRYSGLVLAIVTKVQWPKTTNP